ncbi:MAG: metallophosphoesterase family protein [Deltaproteobacteria bacterium]|nr:metallophosphoesterase family protein [Deltaproteobacteria bacterium]
MKIFAVSDSHISHSNILIYTNRPWLRPGDIVDGKFISNEIRTTRTEEMDNELIRRWNEVVSKDDTVYHLGDFVFAPRKGGEAKIILILEQLNGKIHLIKGNHDHAKQHFWERHGVTFYPDSYTIINGVMLCHYPTYVEVHDDYKDRTKMQRLKEHFKRIYNKNNCRYLLYGHSHNWISPQPRSWNCSVDVNDFRPIEVDFNLDKPIINNLC